MNVIFADYYRVVERLKKNSKNVSCCFEEDRTESVGRRYKWGIKES